MQINAHSTLQIKRSKIWYLTFSIFMQVPSSVFYLMYTYHEDFENIGYKVLDLLLNCLKSALHRHLRISNFILISELTCTALDTLDIFLFVPFICRANEALFFTELVL